MVAVQILDEVYHLPIESIDDSPNLLGRRDKFYHLLQSTRTMAVQSDLNHLRSGVVDQDRTLFIIREFEQLLAEIVAKWICASQYEQPTVLE